MLYLLFSYLPSSFLPCCFPLIGLIIGTIMYAFHPPRLLGVRAKSMDHAAQQCPLVAAALCDAAADPAYAHSTEGQALIQLCCRWLNWILCRAAEVRPRPRE